MFVRQSTYDTVVASHNELSRKNFLLEEALHEILAQETSSPNATVQRILRIAAKAVNQPNRVDFSGDLKVYAG